MKKKFYYTVCAGIVTIAVLISGGCFGGKLAWADATYTKMGGISAKIDNEGSKKKAFVLGTDDELRIQKFGEFGELDLITVKVSGHITTEGLEADTTPITIEDGGKHVTSGNEEVSYYTDWVKLKVRLPSEKAVKVNRLDGKGVTMIDETCVEDGYYFEKVEYIKGDADKSNWGVMSDISNGEEHYSYIGFLDENNRILSEYFVLIKYEIEID